MIRIGDYFKAYAAKKLSAVDIDATRSRQSEIGGTDGLRSMFGTPDDKLYLEGKYVYLDDEMEQAPEIIDAPVTWYDPRRFKPGRRPEYRLLYRTKARPVISRVQPGDTLFVAQQDERNVYMLFVKEGSTVLRQLQWMFGMEAQEVVQVGPEIALQPELESLPVEDLLGLLGIEVDLSDASLLGKMPSRFLLTEAWPTGVEMAQLAQSLVPDADACTEPDVALMQWVQMETRLFQTLEKHKITDQIGAGFRTPTGDVDIEGFLRLSLSVNNRRKSRAGGSLELHMEAVLKANNVQYARQATTEGKKRPDFLFPSVDAYRDPGYPAARLTMLGSKTTLKDRWRQVLNEADRIPNKHLLTLQPGISEDQTDEMKAESLSLVIPRSLHGHGFSLRQQSWLLTVQDFLDELRTRQPVEFSTALKELPLTPSSRY
ncbi:type II restriction endonuclease [Sinomonas soli]